TPRAAQPPRRPGHRLLAKDGPPSLPDGAIGGLMNTAPHLQPEDRADFERVLDAALRVDAVRAALKAPGARMNAEQLRTAALAAGSAIAAEAAEAYQDYIELRERVRHTAAVRRGEQGSARSADRRGGTARLAIGNGAGALPVLTVLVPILAWAAALIFLLLGYCLRLANPRLAFARSLVTAGWAALAVGAIAMFIGIVG